MTRDRLIRILLRLGIVFVALQIAAFLFVLAIFMFLALGGDMPMSGGSDFEWSHSELPR
ncbi:hypothetical protein [Baekduia sp. Peel2402]|uniref:hypothetical protein n=1 Tax=Baekduia sp. Peel2402 TaxID=3458296 RepID=UPI00403EB073